MQLKNLWRQKLFDDISIFISEIKGNVVFLEIRLKELPKLSKYYIKGLSRRKQDNLREELDLNSGIIVTENLITNTENTARNYFIEDGYLNAKVDIVKKPDTAESNSVILGIIVDRGNKVKIADIEFSGNKTYKRPKKHFFDWFGRTEGLSDRRLRKAMKETKRKHILNIFKSSKFIKEDFKEDKKLIIQKYNQNGYRDARIVRDTIYKVSEDRVKIDIEIEEGNKYYFRNITWLGNTKYSSEVLNKILNIRKGDVYDAAYLQERLFLDPQGGDVSSLYLDKRISVF